MNITLIYFDFPFWRAEIPRISLYMANINFKDLRITSDEFKRVKIEGKLDDGTEIPFHQLPCLIVDGVSIAQTGGIARFCGKLSNLYPKNNNLLASIVDQFIDLASDITTIIVNTKTEERDNNFIYEIKRKLTILDKAIKGDSSFLVNNQISVADIAIWSLMCWLTSGNVKGLPKDIGVGYKNLYKICISVDQNIKINDWIKKSYPSNYSRNFL